jgi:hypothetical protein
VAAHPRQVATLACTGRQIKMLNTLVKGGA